jgi:DNA adenine methylase
MTAAQPPLIHDLDAVSPIINVASVPQRSLFRYPGGKTWLVPTIRRWLASLPQQPTEFIDVFAGGAIVGLTVAFEKLAAHVTLVELDEHVASVWQTILGKYGTSLANRIETFDLTAKNVEAVLSQPAKTIQDKAFQTIIRNRVNRGGILAPGAGQIKHGEAGKGIRSRWYPDTLKRRILDIVAIRNEIQFIHGDGLAVMKACTSSPTTAFFIDPPYTAGGKRAGSRLYLHSELDHDELFRIASKIKGNFLMTYDNAPEVRRMANTYGFDMHAIAMKNTHHAEMTELLIGRDLNWAR